MPNFGMRMGTGIGLAARHGGRRILPLPAGPPVSASPPSTSGPGATGVSQQGNNGTWVGGGITFGYQWLRNASPIAGASSLAYTPSAADFGFYLALRVTATNPEGSASAESPPVLVAYDLPSNTAEPAVDVSGESFTADPGTWYGNPTSYSYQWYLNGSPASDGNAQTFNPGALAHDDQVNFQVVASNPSGSGSEWAYPYTHVIPAPVNLTAPVAGKTGDDYHCSTGTWSNSSGTYAYQWHLNGGAFPGETAATLAAPGILFHGDSLSCMVTASNPGGSTEAASNSLTIEIPPAAPVVSEAPIIALDGAIYVVTSYGVWDHGVDYTTYQWHVNGTAVPGETDEIFSATGALEDGDEVHCVLTAHNPSGTGDADSNTIVHVALSFGTIHWLDNSDNEDGFRIEWGTDGISFPSSIQVPPDLTSHAVPFPAPGTYQVRIIAFNHVSGDSPPSNVTSITVS